MKQDYYRSSDGSVEPITYALVRDHLRVDDTPEEQVIISHYMKAARDAFEDMTGHILSSSQTWELYQEFWSGEIEIRKAPVIAVSSIQYYDNSDVLQTLSASTYYVQIYGRCTVIRFKAGTTLPTLSERPDAVKVNFTAGYSTPNNVPTMAKQALLSLIGHWYENRQESVLMPGISEVSIPNGFKYISNQFKLWK